MTKIIRRQELINLLNKVVPTITVKINEKEPARNEIHTLENIIESQNQIRDPYVFEFLGL